MINATTFGPISVQTSGFEEAITLLEQEVVLNELSALLFAHRLQREVASGEFGDFCSIKTLNDEILNFLSLLPAHTGSKWEPLKVASDSDAR